jgi:hypothetical protein
MRSTLPIAFAIGLAVIAVIVGAIFFVQRNDKIDLPGKILKVRTTELDKDSSVAVIDFRVTNPSDVQFEVRTVSVDMEDAAGKHYAGQVSSDTDASSLMKALPVLGEKYNKTLMVKERIGAHGSQDRMVAARFVAPASLLDARKRLVVRIEEVDGKSFEYADR